MTPQSPVLLQPMDDLKDDMNRRLQQQVDELRDRIANDRAENLHLQKELEHLDHELERARMEPDPITLRELESLRDKHTVTLREFDEEKRRTQNERDAHAIEKSTLENELRTRESLMAQQRQQYENENKTLSDRLEQTRVQHSRDLESSRREVTQLRDAEAKRANEYEDKVRKLAAEIDTLRASLAESEADKKKSEADVSGVRADVKRKDELIEMAQRELRLKQERIDELVKTATVLQGEIDDKDQTMKQLKADIDKHKNWHDSLEEQIKTARVGTEDEQRARDRYQKAYDELAAAIGASDAQIKGLLATSTANAVMQKLADAEHEVTVLSREIEDHKNSIESERIKVTQADRERDKHKESVLAHKDEISVAKRQLLDNTVELRAMIADQEKHLRQIAVQEARISSLEDEVKKADDTIKELQEARQGSEKQLTASAAEWDKEKARIEETAIRDMETMRLDHDGELAALQAQLGEMEVEGRDQVEYADVCRALSRLLKIDLGTSAAALAREVYHRVEMLLDESDSLKGKLAQAEKDRDMAVEEAREAADYHRHHHSMHGSRDMRPLTSSAHHHTSSSHDAHNHSLFSGAFLRNGGSGSLTGGSHGDAEKIRKNLVTQKLEYDRFVQDVATALGVKKLAGERINTRVLVDRIQDIMSEGPIKSISTRSDTHGRSHGSRDKSGGKKGGKVPREDHELLQRKFRIALRTIDTLDLVIKDLQDRLPEADVANESGFTEPGSVQSTLHSQNHELQEEVRKLKQQLYSKDHAPNALDLGGHGEPSDIEYLRKDLEKYTKFYDDVLRALGHRSINIKMDAIIAEIRELKDASLGISVGGVSTGVHRTLGRPVSATMRSGTSHSRHWKP